MFFINDTFRYKLHSSLTVSVQQGRILWSLWFVATVLVHAKALLVWPTSAFAPLCKWKQHNGNIKTQYSYIHDFDLSDSLYHSPEILADTTFQILLKWTKQKWGYYNQVEEENLYTTHQEIINDIKVQSAVRILRQVKLPFS